MKEIQRINVYNTEDKIIIGYLDNETNTPDIENLNLTITSLTQDQQDLTNECISLLENTLSTGEILKRSLMQISLEQHMCNERILIWFDNGEEDLSLKIYPKLLMNESDQLIYEGFKNMCISLLD